MSASTVPPPQPNCACGLVLRLFTELLTNYSMIMAMAPTFTGNSIINRKPNLSAFCTNKDRYRTEIITFDFSSSRGDEIRFILSCFNFYVSVSVFGAVDAQICIFFVLLYYNTVSFIQSSSKQQQCDMINIKLLNQL